MNAAGISVFYGALDLDTCVAEMRAPVGGSVVAGRFEVIRSVRLLDMDALAQVYIKGSHFDPQFGVQRARAAFLSCLVQMISRPVMPNDETFEYLPTQVIAEYLATKVTSPVDGILFRSSRTGGGSRNIILFNHACSAEQDDTPPGTTFDVIMGSGPEDDPDPTVMVWEKLPPPEPPPEPVGLFGTLTHSVRRPPVDREPDEGWLPDRAPTLRLDPTSVFVLRVKSIQYECEQARVFRSRTDHDGKPVRLKTTDSDTDDQPF
jgi:RES domain